MAATELSGLRLRDDMSDTLVVAISQSGTTTDTNRTVDLARGARCARDRDRQPAQQRPRRQVRRRALHVRRARRRDERCRPPRRSTRRSPPGYLLALAIASELDAVSTRRVHTRSSTALRALPDAMHDVLAQRERDRRRSRSVTRRRAATGRSSATGCNRIAADEVRIKLSELCYKSIACDATEDKKHIDLSAEPLILVCAAGLQGSNADDVAKEVAIYRAHRAAPIVIATEGEDRFAAALETIAVPAVAPRARVRAVDDGRAPLRLRGRARDRRVGPAAARGAGRDRGGGGDGRGRRPRRRPAHAPRAASSTRRRAAFFDGLRAGSYDGDLEAGTAVRLASLLRYATGSVLARRLRGRARQGRHAEHGGRRPHRRAHRRRSRSSPGHRRDQAPGQDGHRRHLPLRRDAAPGRRWSREVLAAGAARDGLSYRVAAHAGRPRPRGRREVTGFTRYRIEGDLAADAATLHVVDRGGISSVRVAHRRPIRASAAPSTASRRSARSPSRAGAATAAPSCIVPEVKGNETVGLTLLHVRLRRPPARRRGARGAPGLPGPLRRAAGRGHRDRADLRRRACSPTFDLVDLLTEPVYVLADRWRWT